MGLILTFDAFYTILKNFQKVILCDLGFAYKDVVILKKEVYFWFSDIFD